MRPWLPDPRVLNVLIRSGISVGPEDVRTHLPLWRLELRKQLQEKPTSDGKPMTRAEADSCIDKALASGALDSNGNLHLPCQGDTRANCRANSTSLRAMERADD